MAEELAKDVKTPDGLNRLLKSAELSQIQGKIKRENGVYKCK